MNGAGEMHVTGELQLVEPFTYGRLFRATADNGKPCIRMFFKYSRQSVNKIGEPFFFYKAANKQQ